MKRIRAAAGERELTRSGALSSWGGRYKQGGKVVLWRRAPAVSDTGSRGSLPLPPRGPRPTPSPADGAKKKYSPSCWEKLPLGSFSSTRSLTSRCCCRCCWVLRPLASNCLHGYSHYGAAGSRGNCCYPPMATSGPSLRGGGAEGAAGPAHFRPAVGWIGTTRRRS